MAMQAGALREGEPLSEINTTPLIDVMLVLLIMLIVTLPPQRHAVKLDTPVPCKAGQPLDNQPDPITVAIDYSGGNSWNGAPSPAPIWTIGSPPKAARHSRLNSTSSPTTMPRTASSRTSWRQPSARASSGWAWWAAPNSAPRSHT